MQLWRALITKNLFITRYINSCCCSRCIHCDCADTTCRSCLGKHQNLLIVTEGNMHTISIKWRHDVLRYWLKELFCVNWSLVYWPFTQEILERNSQPFPNNALIKSAPKSRYIYRCRPKCTVWRIKCTPPVISSNDERGLANWVIAYNNMYSSFFFKYQLNIPTFYR